MASGHVQRSSFPRLYLGKFTKIPSVLLRDGLPVVLRSDDEGPCSEAQSTGSAALYDLAPSSRRRARIPRGRSWSLHWARAGCTVRQNPSPAYVPGVLDLVPHPHRSFFSTGHQHPRRRCRPRCLRCRRQGRAMTWPQLGTTRA